MTAAHRSIFDDEHEMFREAMRTFVQREITPNFDAWERDGIVSKELFRRAGEAGILGIGAPADLGGGGAADFRFNVVFMEEVCRAGVMNAGLGISTQADVVMPYYARYGTPEQQKRWVPSLCAGDMVGAVAMTEPGAGSDLAGIASHATLDGDHYILNGSKVFISNGINADLIIVVCRTALDASPRQSLSLLVVDTGLEGFVRGRNLDKLGQHAADTAEMFFDDVHVPSDCLLGEEGKAFYHLMAMLPQERLSIATTALAHAEVAFEQTLEYCKERTAFGQAIGSFQNTRFQLATMRTELDVARVFIDAQIAAHVDGHLTAEQAAQGKWWCTELSNRVLSSCLQLHGGLGYMEECAVGRAWRDGRAMAIYGGTTEIMKDIIGRRMLGV